eukprot:6467026-Amphidinium_carterae.4
MSTRGFPKSPRRGSGLRSLRLLGRLGAGLCLRDVSVWVKIFEGPGKALRVILGVKWFYSPIGLATSGWVAPSRTAAAHTLENRIPTSNAIYVEQKRKTQSFKSICPDQKL